MNVLALSNGDVQPYIWGIGLVTLLLVCGVVALLWDEDRAFAMTAAGIVVVVCVSAASIIGWFQTAGPGSEAYRTARGKGDSDVLNIDQSPAFVLEMPDEFSSIATKCVWEGLRAFTTSGDGGMAVVADEACEMPEFVPADEATQ